MNAWFDIALTVLIILLPGIQLVRDWKFGDKRTKRHHGITKMLLSLTLLCAVGAGVGTCLRLREQRRLQATLQTLAEDSQKKVRFRVFVNNIDLSVTNAVEIHRDNDAYTLRFVVQNDGDTVATIIQAALLVPANISCNLPEGWRQGAATLFSESGMEEGAQMLAYQATYYTPVYPPNAFVFETSIAAAPRIPDPSFLLLSLAANRQPIAKWTIYLKLKD